MPHNFETRFAESWPVDDWATVTVVIAISGGADSVALLRAMVGLRNNSMEQPWTGRLCAGHFNHRLRPEADADERFVRELCAELKIPCEVAQAADNQIAASPGESIEEAARRLRYAFLKTTAERLGARYVVTAHTADDQAETILHRILRGTGLSGLSGIARTRPLGHASLIRPLLAFRRQDIERYLADLGQSYCRDASNFDCRFTRNRLRHELLPLLVRQYNAQSVEAILRLGSLAGEVQTVVDQAVEGLFEQAVHIESSTAARINLLGLEKASSYLLRELFMQVWRKQNWPLQAMGFEEWTLLEEMARASRALSPKNSEKKILPGAITVETVLGEIRLTSEHQHGATKAR